jgi:PAS domain S-box-containing protein
VFPSSLPFFASIVVALAYFVGAKIGFALTVGPHPVSLLWPANTILLVALVLTPVRSWAMILLAVLPVHLAVEWQSGVPFHMILCWFVSNACEALIGAAGVRYLVQDGLEFDRFRAMGAFLLCGVLLAPLLSSFLDAALVELNHWGKDTYWEVWRVRFCSNTFASATVGVGILSWAAGGPRAKMTPGRIFEAASLVLGLVSVAVLVLFHPLGPRPDFMQSLWPYVPWPILLWAALRFGIRGASASLLIVSTITILSVVAAHTPFLEADERNVRSIQMFFVVMSLTLMPLASLLREREMTYRDLRVSEERYRGIVENQSDLVCRVLPDTTLTFVSRSYCRFFQGTRKELIGRKFLDLVPQAAHAHVMDSIRSAIRDGQTVVCEHEVLLPGGGIGWHQWINQPIFNEHGEVSEIQAIGRDITKRRRAELALGESRERMHAILRAIPDSIFLVDQSGVVLECHAHDEVFLLVHPAQSIGNHIRNVFIRDLAEELQRCFEVVAQTGRMTVAQRTLVVGAAKRCYEARIVRSGPDRFLGLVRDITEQKEAEEALKAGEERYREVVESQTELVFRCTPDMTLTFANEAYCRFFGRPRQHLVGRRLLEFFPPALHSKVMRSMGTVIGSCGAAIWEHLFTLPDGHARWIQWTDYAIVDSNGDLKEIQGIGKDITDRKRAEEARQNLIHVSRLAVIGESTASIAHEISQPLNAILTNTEAARALLRNGAVPLDQIRAILADVHQDVLRTRETISRMRAFSQRREMEMQPLDINGLIEDVVRLTAGEASRRRVQVRTDLAPKLPMAQGDPVHIQHILLNLLLNGMEAMGEVAESERVLSIATENREDQELVIAVKDKGHGIPPEIRPRVFQSFFSTKATGLGLGLSIASTIVKAHGGRIWVEDNSDRGVTFRFTLPLAT